MARQACRCHPAPWWCTGQLARSIRGREQEARLIVELLRQGRSCRAQMPGFAGRCASPAWADSPAVPCNGTPWLARHRIRVSSARHGSAAHPIRNSLCSSGLCARTSLLIRGRPPRQRRHEPDTQIAHKPRRRQRNTVAGWTTIRLCCQFTHQRDRKTQNSRSLGRKHGRRVPDRCSTAI